jgi:hypothetical protein
MYPLTVKGALAYVRKAIDELTSVEDIGMLVSPDAVNLHRLVEGCMVEAVLKTYAQAPAESMEGVVAEEESDYKLIRLKDGVVTISFETPIARMLSLRCVDSEIIVSDLVPENSAEARKQLNKYVRGTFDDPRVVLQKVWNGDNMPILKYYTTTKMGLDEVSFDIEVLPYPALVEGVVQIASRMEYPVLNNIVALVLDAYKETELADRYRAKAKEYLES